MRRVQVVLGAVLTVVLLGGPIRPAAADTLQELPVEGLAFAHGPGVGLDLEQVVVTLEAVDFKYQLANTGVQPVPVDIMLRLPKLDLSDPDQTYAFPTDDPVNFLGATLSINGTPVPLPFRQTALIDAKDVTRALREANLPPLSHDGFQARLAALAPDQLAPLIAGGLIRQNGAKDGGTALLFPAWSVRTTAVLHQHIDPGQPMVVETRALESLGASQDTVLRKALRQEEGLLADVAGYRDKYCIDEAFLGGVDKIAGAAPDNAAHLGERRIDLVLVPPAQADMPVGTFRLVIDKGRPDNLISTCLNDLKKTSPTSFELTTSNAVPPRKLHILIVGRF